MFIRSFCTATPSPIDRRQNELIAFVNMPQQETCFEETVESIHRTNKTHSCSLSMSVLNLL